MRRLISFFIVIIVVQINGCNSQTYSEQDEQAIELLNEFYRAHCDIWSTPPSEISPKIFHEKLDLLAEKYSTHRVREEAKEWLADGHDLFTNDWGIDVESLSSLTINKDLTKENSYLVSYVVESFPVSPNSPVKTKVTLRVGVVKEGGKFKIDSVK